MAAALLKDTLLQSMMTEQQLCRLVPQNVADLVVKVGRLDDICHVRPCAHVQSYTIPSNSRPSWSRHHTASVQVSLPFGCFSNPIQRELLATERVVPRVQNKTGR